MFETILDLWHFSSLVDYYFKFSFDLKAILYLAKDKYHVFRNRNSVSIERLFGFIRLILITEKGQSNEPYAPIGTAFAFYLKICNYCPYYG